MCLKYTVLPIKEEDNKNVLKMGLSKFRYIFLNCVPKPTNRQSHLAWSKVRIDSIKYNSNEYPTYYFICTTYSNCITKKILAFI